MVFSPVPELPFLPAPTGLYGFWKHYLNYLLSNKGGLFFLECNYDVKRTNILPTFYPHELLSWWAELREVVDPDRGHEYILWNNREIMIEGKTVSVYRYYFDNGVIFTKDLLDEKTNTQSFRAMKEQGLTNCSNFFVWTGLRQSVPSKLRVKLRGNVNVRTTTIT